jgi:predicted transcriptional regulator
MARSSTSLRGNKAGRQSSTQAIDLSVNAVWNCVRSPFRLRLLETIRGSGGCTVLEIARALDVSPPSLYYHIGLLLKSGLIGQMVPTLLLFPFADRMIERFEDGDVRFR